MRIRMIWATRSGSQTASTGSPAEAQLELRLVLRRAPARTRAATVSASSPTSVGSGRSSSEPASSRERSSRSVASLPSRSTCSRTWSQEARARLLVELLVLEQLEEAAEREDRRAQLVRRGRDEAPARGLELRRAGAACRRARARAGRARRRRSTGKRAREVAGRDALGDVLQAPHAARERARDEVAGEHRERAARSRRR